MKKKKLTVDHCREYIEKNLFHTSNKDRIGIELEMMPFTCHSSEKANVFSYTPFEKTVSWLIAHAKENNWNPIKETYDGMDHVIQFTMKRKDTLTFEPGGQLEYSSYPCSSLVDLKNRVTTIQDKLTSIFHEHRSFFVQAGINPTETVKTVGLQVKKPRYQCMNHYFKMLSPYGQEMMRLTGAIQITLDFGHDESTLVKRYLGSQLLTPFATAIFANSSYLGKKNTPCKGYRSRIWRHLDPSRTMFPSLKKIVQENSKASCVESYLDFVLNSNVIFIEKSGQLLPVNKNITLKEWMDEGINNTYPDIHDLEICLSLLFPNVRPKGFLELRAVDCLPKKWQLIPACFFSGLLYHPESLDKTIELLLEDIDHLPKLLALSENGLEDPGIFEKSKLLMHMSIEGYKKLPSSFRDDTLHSLMLDFYDTYTSRKKVPADSFIDYIKKHPLDYLDFFKL